jgi:hypothetical protein
MYSKECPVEGCGVVLHDDDMDRLINHMKAHIKTHEDDDVSGVKKMTPQFPDVKEDEMKMKSTAVEVIEAEPLRMKEDEGFKDFVPSEVVVHDGFMSPAATLDEAFHAFEMFDKAKERLLRDRDVVWFGKSGAPVKKGTPDAKPYLLKSAWRRMARFFGLSIDVEGREKVGESDDYIWVYRYRITHPCGAYVVSEGVCSSKDSFFTKGGRVQADEADVMLKAQTVAINRGVSDLLGSGEVSGEEMMKVSGGD